LKVLSGRDQSSWFIVFGLYLLACGVMLSPLIDFLHLPSASFEGDPRLVIWILGWNNHVILDGIPSLFDANMFHPDRNTLALTEHLFGISLFTLPIYAVTRNPVLAYNIVWLLSFLLSALSVHLLVWRILRNHSAALVAGLVYAFGFFKMHQGHAHLQIIWSFWIPVSLVLVERWFARPTWMRMAGLLACVILQALASWYLAVMILVADALWLGWLMLERYFTTGRLTGIGSPRALLIQLVAALLLVGVLLSPFVNRYAAMSPGNPTEASAQSADLAAYFVPPENTWPGRALQKLGSTAPRWIWGERTLYVGYVTLALAGIGVWCALRERVGAFAVVRFCVALALVAFALSLGPADPHGWGWSPFGLFARLPAMTLFRVPARFALLVMLAVAVLAGVGAWDLGRRLGNRAPVAMLLGIPLLLSESFVIGFPGGRPRQLPIPAVYRHLAALPPGAVVSLPDFLQTAEWYREADYLYFSTAHWKPIVNGYARVTPARFADRIRHIQTFPSMESANHLRSLGVTYVVVHAGVDEAAIARARQSGDFSLLLHADEDYLFRVNPN
jgi:hypothetical protein